MNLNAPAEFVKNLLLEKGLLSDIQWRDFDRDVATPQTFSQAEFEKILIDRGLITEETLLKFYSDYLHIPFVSLAGRAIDPRAGAPIPPKFAHNHRLIAVGVENGELVVAVRDPFELSALDELKLLTKKPIRPVLARAEEIAEALKTYYGVGAETVERLVKDREPDELVDAARERARIKGPEDIAQEASMVQYVQQLLFEAHEQRATDIHIEPFANRLRVRYRIDGVLTLARTPPDIKKLQEAILSRLKIMANLNIAERRRPQEGRCRVQVKGRDIDLRVATFPTLHGEGMSIRLLDRGSMMLDIDQLGLASENLAVLKKLIRRPNGIILVTGPTGCGKTTTLYSHIQFLNDTKTNIVTLEDPVEYQLDGVIQIQTNTKVDLTFANGFRSILRQDPDVILVGEIRDQETAQIAIRAALTGHLIFSTLHTNSALATITRLLDIGIEPYLIANTLKAVIAQRLVRVICPQCKEPAVPGNDLRQALGIASDSRRKAETFYQGKGCAACGQTGYQGRIAIFEVLEMDETLCRLLTAGATMEKLTQAAANAGFRTLKDDGIEKASRGLTTLDEILKVSD